MGINFRGVVSVVLIDYVDIQHSGYESETGGSIARIVVVAVTMAYVMVVND